VPQVSAGPDVQLPFGSAVYVRGTISDDGRPVGFVSAKWSKVSGPGLVMFGSPTQIQTPVGFGAPGTYVLRLTANDGLLSASDDMTVVVGTSPPVNAAPQVFAGLDQSAAGPAILSLDGTVTDDGLPGSPNALTSVWTVLSGPGPVSFANTAAVDTFAGFTTPGTYVLRLTANDGLFCREATT